MELPDDPFTDHWLLRPPERITQPRFVLPVRVDPLGRRGPTPKQARGPFWRRTARGRYVPTRADLDQPAQRIVEAAARTGPAGAVTGWASLHLAGARYFEGRTAAGAELPVPLAWGRDQHREAPPGVVGDRVRLLADEVEMRCGVACTSVERAVRDEVRRRAELWEGVCAVEMACHAELTSLARLEEYAARRTRGSERRHLLEVLAVAVEGAESPPEVHLRRIWTEVAGLPTPLANVEVFSNTGRFLARPDLLDPAAGFAGDYDGEHHRDTRFRRRDLTREGLLRNHGLEYLSVVGGEMWNQRRVAERVRSTAARARLSGLPRRWTITPPPGRERMTLDERLDLRERLALPLAGPGFAVPARPPRLS